MLDLQELDSRLDALAHRLATLPETRQLVDLAARREGLDAAVRDLTVTVSDLAEEQRRADADVEQVKARRERDQGMIDRGAVSDPKALERMVGELESLQRRISSLEDVEIEVMERVETAESDLAQRTAELAAVDSDLGTVRAAETARKDEIGAEVERVRGERAALAADVPADLLALYDTIRAKKDGVGAAALRRKECAGCRLTLNASELSAIAAAPADDVLRCEECNRILVRSVESGL